MANVFNTKRALRIYGISALSAAFACVILRLIGTLFFFDVDIGYYQSGQIVPIIANILPAIAAIASIVFCLISRIKIAPVSPFENKYTKYGSAVAAVGFAIFAVTYALSLAEYSELYGALPFSYLLCLICSVGACAFFTLKTFRAVNSDILYLLTGLLAIIWCVLQLAECYFDTFVQMNSPIKLVFQFACLCAMLLTVNEMRIGLESKRNGFHLLSATLATIFLPMSAIPSIICYLTDNMPTSYVLFFPDCVMLLLSVFAVTRLVQMCFGKEAAVPSEVYEEATDTQEQVPEEAVTDTAEEES